VAEAERTDASAAAAADLTAVPEVVAEVPPEIVAQSLGEYVRGWAARIRAGESGVLPVVVAMIAIAIVFEALQPKFLSPGNLVNLFQQSAVFMVLAMAESFALVLGEIDLSVGFVGGCGAAITVQLVQPLTFNWPWWAAVIAGLGFCAAFGAVQGILITRLRLPSFIVTLAGLLIANGLFLTILLINERQFSGYPSLVGNSLNLQILYNLMWGNIDPIASWVVAGVAVVGLGALIFLSDQRRRTSGLVAPPLSLSLIKVGLIAAVAVVVVAICDVNRANLGTLEGVPWAIPIVMAVLALWTIVFQRTQYGRYLYAIGGNPEAARRAGINLALVRTTGFALCSLTAGIAILLYASLLNGMNNNFRGNEYVLYAVAAAVIGGTSLFGGRGKPLHGVLGGLVIGGIYNGTFLLGLEVQWEFIITGLVLLAAVTIDSLSRRGSASGSVTRV
jgi:D-xylose transport system permease protein